MEEQKQTMGDYMGTLTDDAQALMASTSDVAGEKVKEARKRLASALGSGKEIYQQVRAKAVEGVKSTDQAVRENPYQAIAIAFGAGALLGFLLSRRCGRNCVDA
jgi:ElaB/YqjD/DUF883 family membrane-anchored ribosome-binding protein